MFNNDKLEELTNQVRELVQVNRALLTKIESQNKCWITLADHVSRNSGDAPFFGVVDGNHSR